VKLVHWLLLSVLSLPTLANETISVASGEYPPFSGHNLPHEGYVSHLVRLAYGLQGIEVDYEYMPWARSLEETSLGHYGVSIFWFCTQERKLDFYCSEQSLIAEAVNIFHRVDTELGDWKSYRDLTRFRFGLTRGYAYDQKILDAVDQGILSGEFVGSDLQNMRKLLAGRIDLFLIGEESGNDILNQHFSAQQREEITMDSTPIFISNFHVLFSKAHPKARYWQEQFDSGMAKLKASAKFHKLRADFEAGKYNR